MCAKADQDCFHSKTFADQLTDVELAVLTHLGRACIAQMRIVRPNDGLWLAAAIQMRDQSFNRLDHVTIAQIPGRRAAAKHGAIILLGVLDQARVLFGQK